MCLKNICLQISAAITEKNYVDLFIASSISQITAHTHVLGSMKRVFKSFYVVWCVAEKNCMQIRATITKKLIYIHMSLNKPIFDN